MKRWVFEIGILVVGIGFWMFAEFLSNLGYITLLITIPVGLVAAGIMIHFSQESNKRR